MDTEVLIMDLVAADLPRLPPTQRSWVSAHLADPPRLVELSGGYDGSDPVQLWLVTEHTGSQDSSCRVVFDPQAQAFGLVMDLQGGIEWFMGLNQGGFADTVMAM